MRAATGVLVVLLIAGCESAKPPESAESPVPTAPPISSGTLPAGKSSTGSASTEATKKAFEGITLTIPAGWEEQPPPNDIIQAEYRIGTKAGSIRVTMSSAGGSKEANVQRWRGQFSREANDPEPQQETVVIDGEEAILVELVGTFRDGFGGGGEQRKHCMLGAVIPTGPANFFVKMTGPREAVLEHREEFRTLVISAKFGK